MTCDMEIKVGNGIVRIHGKPDMERIKKACQRYVERVGYAVFETDLSVRNDSDGDSADGDSADEKETRIA